jgi:hypothetical protein
LPLLGRKQIGQILIAQTIHFVNKYLTIGVCSMGHGFRGDGQDAKPFRMHVYNPKVKPWPERRRRRLMKAPAAVAEQGQVHGDRRRADENI